MCRVSEGRIRRIRSANGSRAPRSSGKLDRPNRLIRSTKALLLALLLCGGFAAAPAWAQEAAPAERSAAATQALTFEFDARPKATSGGLSLQLGGGSWERAVDELQSDQLAWDGMGQLAQQAPDAEGGGAGNVLANPDEISRQSNNPLGGNFPL